MIVLRKDEDYKNHGKEELKIIIMELLREIKDKILLKRTREDKNGQNYLILELEKGEKIFVFDNKSSPSERWTELKETK